MEELGTLVRAAQAGDKDASGQIVRRFQDMAFAFGYAMLGDAGLAQDAAQDAFIDAYLSLPNLREPAAFPGWHAGGPRRCRAHGASPHRRSGPGRRARAPGAGP